MSNDHSPSAKDQWEQGPTYDELATEELDGVSGGIQDLMKQHMIELLMEDEGLSFPVVGPKRG